MHPETLGAVLWASRRSARVVHEDMRRGLDALATMAYLAPWFGLLATVLTIPESFVGCGGERSSCMAAMVIRLSRSIWPAAFGLMIGLISAWGSRYLNARLESFDRAMEGAALDLVNQLSRHKGRWTFGPATERQSDGPIFGAPEAKPEIWCHSATQTAAVLIGAWFLEAVRYFQHDYLPLHAVPLTACEYVLLVFVLSLVPAYFLWAKLLYRRPTGLLDLSAAICLCWCAAELIFAVQLP